MKRYSGIFIAGLIALLAAAALAAAPAAKASAETAPTPQQRLAERLARGSIRLLQSDPTPLHAMEASVILIEEAARLAPRDPENWRLMLAIATMMEREDLRQEALQQLVQLDPNDEVARLQWTIANLRDHQTAEDLAAELQRLLEPGSRQRLGAAISSRLALDLALLERRRGNNEQFADRLAQAVALDPAHHAAAALAAGYFQANVDDPVDEGELLLQLVLSNPADVEAQLLFAAHLLGYGAYAGAERFYAMALQGHAPLGGRPQPDLVADAAIAQWGRGDAEGALRRLSEYQRERDIALQQRLHYERPDLGPMERAQYASLPTPTFATVRTAIRHRLGEGVGSALALAIRSYDQAITETGEANGEIDPEDRERQMAMLRLEKGWVMLWLGGGVAEAREVIQAVRSAMDLSDAAEARFDGWEALRLGELSRAINLLRPHAEHDAPSRLGLALALVENGDRREGARELLALARAQPGTLIGVYAADTLAEVLGQRVALSAEAAALDQRAAGAPRQLDRFAREPTSALSMRITPAQTTFPAYAPVILNVEISNNSPLPLAIDPAGPIQPQLILLASAQGVATSGGVLPPIVVGIDRKLRLMPRERLVIPVDLRRTIVGDLLDRAPVAGAMVRMRGVINFRATPQGTIVPGLLGSQTSPVTVRVDGARVTARWIEETLQGIRGELDRPSLTRIALLGAAAAGELGEGAGEAERRLLREAREGVAEAFAALDGPSQAWLLSVLPPVEAHRGIDRIARDSEDRHVRMAYLLFRTRDGDDPVVRQVRRAGDENLRRIADLVARGVEEYNEPLMPDLEDALEEEPERAVADPHRALDPDLPDPEQEREPMP